MESYIGALFWLLSYHASRVTVLLLQSLLSAIYVNNRFFQLCYSLFTLRKNGSDMVWPKIDHISHQIGVVISGVP